MFIIITDRVECFSSPCQNGKTIIEPIVVLKTILISQPNDLTTDLTITQHMFVRNDACHNRYKLIFNELTLMPNQKLHAHFQVILRTVTSSTQGANIEMGNASLYSAVMTTATLSRGNAMVRRVTGSNQTVWTARETILVRPFFLINSFIYFHQICIKHSLNKHQARMHYVRPSFTVSRLSRRTFSLVQPLLKKSNRLLNGFPSWRGYTMIDSFEHVD